MRISDWSSDVCSSDLARWRAGEAWDTTPLWWMPGQRPKYSELVSFSQELSDAVGRPCVAYGIKDKRERKLDFQFEDGSLTAFGSQPSAWLLGVGSSRRAPFSRSETAAVLNIAAATFAPSAHMISTVESVVTDEVACRSEVHTSE